jgi:antitoxin component of RelBE/YafQ-DinJ toxin-antitoxin module
MRYDGRMPKEPMRTRPIRVSDDLWARAKKRADEKGETVSEAVRKFLERYAR